MISIVIPNYNGKHLLKTCLDAIKEQSFIDYECIIVDNGSEDGSYDYLKEEYPHVELIQLDKNYGFSYAVNRGIDISKGEYIALLNNDTQVDKDWLYYLHKHITGDAAIFSVGSKMLKFQDSNRIDDAGEEYTLLGWAYQLGAGKSITQYVKPYQVFANCGGAVLYRKSVLEEIGLLDEGFFAYMEDIDIGYRARIRGYKNTYEPKSKVLHVGSATSGSQYNSFKAKLIGRNNIWVPYKNMPLLQLLINIPFLLMGFMIKILFFYKKGFAKEYTRGIIEGIRGYKRVTKTQYTSKYLKNYIYIEYLLIKNIFKLVYEKLR